jgi:hypothetical protein
MQKVLWHLLLDFPPYFSYWPQDFLALSVFTCRDFPAVSVVNGRDFPAVSVVFGRGIFRQYL